jgi:hypothetical protein
LDGGLWVLACTLLEADDKQGQVVWVWEDCVPPGDPGRDSLQPWARSLWEASGVTVRPGSPLSWGLGLHSPLNGSMIVWSVIATSLMSWALEDLPESPESGVWHGMASGPEGLCEHGVWLLSCAWHHHIIKVRDVGGINMFPIHLVLSRNVLPRVVSGRIDQETWRLLKD